MLRAVRPLAVAAVITFQAFLALSSQYLFAHIDPHPLDSNQTWVFNALVVCFWTCFFRSSLTSPCSPRDLPALEPNEANGNTEKHAYRKCRKCIAPKPPRWHHCKVCQTCIPKMDHHCIWINNCVSHVTFPHFIRFLLYSVAGMSYLQYFLFIRFKVLWDHRNLPHYLGPTAPQLIHLFALGVTNSMALLFLTVLLSNAMYSLFTNVYKIEGWELERHEALVERARRSGGYVYGPGGIEVRIQKQEFPYDIGFWDNVVQGMGTANPLAWFWPLSRSPSVASAVDWPINGFEDASKTWPPPDPEKMSLEVALVDQAAARNAPDYSDGLEMAAFRRRQDQDIASKRRAYSAEHSTSSENLDDEERADEAKIDWKNADGERLEDFGVDETAETLEEDDIPLSDLIRRKKRP